MGYSKNADALTGDIEAAYANGDITDAQYEDLMKDEAATAKYNKLRYGALAVFCLLVGGIILAGTL